MRITNRTFLGLVLTLLALRFLHFGPHIDGPHDWRQCDTAYFIFDFFKNGIDLRHPAVCWMGGSDTVVLEFPILQGLVAVFYAVFGESIVLARLVFFGLFTGAAYYFFRLANHLFGRSSAQLACIIYVGLPLSLYYSRAIQVDFGVVFLTHFMAYYFILGLEANNRFYMLLSAVSCALAFLIKAPYVFYWAIPLVIYAWHTGLQRRLIYLAPVYLLALVPFLWWQYHTSVVNGMMPNLDYILHYRKLDDNLAWYVGTWEQRTSLYRWSVLFKRGVFEVTGIVGFIFFLLGLRDLRQSKHKAFLIGWMVIMAIYAFVFFSLNVIHSYYQIPFLAPASMVMAIGLQWTFQKSKLVGAICMAVILMSNILFAERNYYTIAWDEISIGKTIQENTSDSALIIVTYNNMDCRNPKILYRARRRGWSIEKDALNPEVINRLHREQGAEYWAMITSDPSIPMQYESLLGEPKIYPSSSGHSTYLFALGN